MSGASRAFELPPSATGMHAQCMRMRLYAYQYARQSGTMVGHCARGMELVIYQCTSDIKQNRAPGCQAVTAYLPDIGARVSRYASAADI